MSFFQNSVSFGKASHPSCANISPCIRFRQLPGKIGVYIDLCHLKNLRAFYIQSDMSHYLEKDFSTVFACQPTRSLLGFALYDKENAKKHKFLVIFYHNSEQFLCD